MTPEEVARDYLSRLDHLTALADSKAVAFLSISLVVAATVVASGMARLLGQPPFGGDPADLDALGWYLPLGVASVASTAGVLWNLANALMPRQPNNAVLKTPNVLFFRSAAALHLEEFTKQLRAADFGSLAEQCHQSARIVERKMRGVALAARLLFAQAATGLLMFMFLLSH